MRARVDLANLAGRATLIAEGRVLDVERRSNGTFSADPMAVLRDWTAFSTWASGQRARAEDPVLEPERLGPCVPRPRQVFGIGLNYRSHAEELNLRVPATPLVFTKFPSCLSGPRCDIALTSDSVDFEIELVVVLSRGGHHISEATALEHVAGYTVGQDISDRKLQFSGAPAQFSLGKSAPGFGPIGPAVVALAAFADPNDLELTCSLSGEPMQASRTTDMIFNVPALIAYLSRHVTLEAGDLIFTGSPGGVGSARNPPRHLVPGDVIESQIESIGGLANRCLGPSSDV